MGKEKMNKTWIEVNNWVADDPTRKIQFLFGLPGIMNSISLVGLTMVDSIFSSFFRRWAIEERTWFTLLVFFLFNGILVSGFFAPFFEKHLLRSVQFGPLPSLDRLFLEFVAICVVEDAYFYYVHRLSHQWRWFYNKVHYLHHEWTAPTALSISYMHPLEWLIVNMSLTFVGPVLLSTHAVSTWAYYVFIFTKGVINHCGYNIPAPHVMSSTFHDAHHRLFSCNYGSYGLFDYLHGTIRK